MRNAIRINSPHVLQSQICIETAINFNCSIYIPTATCVLRSWSGPKFLFYRTGPIFERNVIYSPEQIACFYMPDWKIRVLLKAMFLCEPFRYTFCRWPLAKHFVFSYTSPCTHSGLLGYDCRFCPRVALRLNTLRQKRKHSHKMKKKENITGI